MGWSVLLQLMVRVEIGHESESGALFNRRLFLALANSWAVGIRDGSICFELFKHPKMEHTTTEILTISMIQIRIFTNHRKKGKATFRSKNLLVINR